MANERKSIIDEALLESEQIEKAFKANAEEVLNRTMGSEIEELVRESLEGSRVALMEDEDEEEGDVDLDLDLDDEGEDDLDIDINAGGAGEDLDLGDMDDELDFEDEDELNMDTDVVDLTDADDDEVIRVFKLMGPEDEIEVVQDGGNIDIKDTATGAEYRIQLGGEEGDLGDMDDEMEDEDELELDDMGGENLNDMDFEDENELDMDDEMEDEDELGEGVIYEIEIEDEDEIEENTQHTKVNLRRHNLKPSNLKNESLTSRNTQVINENRVLKNTISSVKAENEQLKEDYNRMVDALKEFRNKLNEVAVFNSNLTYAVRLFTENTTTKEEKMEIIKRFDDVKTLKESKATYKQLVKEISKSTPIKESVENKLNQTKASGSATLINESKVYVNPELEKMKKLWDYNYKQ